MLKIINAMHQLDFSQLVDMSMETIEDSGRQQYPLLSAAEQICNAEQDFYHYLKTVFFRQENSCYAVWVSDGRYQSALRLEPYRDGLLLCALETAPSARELGYATNLVRAVISRLSEQGSGTIYSHVVKSNAASLAVHRKCGFQITKDYAVYSDGSVMHSSYTLSVTY